MPSKFSCRQLRETGQDFENFLLVQGLDNETNREELRNIYNRDFKTRYGPAHSLAQNRGPHLPPRPPRRDHPSRPSAETGSSRSGSSRSRGGAVSPSRAVPTPRPRPEHPARSALLRPGPCAEVPAESLLRSRSPAPRARGGVLRPPAARGCRGDSAGRGGGAPGLGARASRKRGEGASWW